QVAMGSTLNVLVSPVSSSWLESNATWYNQPAAGSSPQTNQVMSGSTYSQYQIDVKTFVEAWRDGTLTNHGFQLRSAGGEEIARKVECRSSESATGSQRPMLTVEWE